MGFCKRILGCYLAAASPFLLAAPAAGSGGTDPDQMLIGVYRDLGNRHLRDALAKVLVDLDEHLVWVRPAA